MTRDWTYALVEAQNRSTDHQVEVPAFLLFETAIFSHSFSSAENLNTPPPLFIVTWEFCCFSTIKSKLYILCFIKNPFNLYSVFHLLLTPQGLFHLDTIFSLFCVLTPPFSIIEQSLFLYKHFPVFPVISHVSSWYHLIFLILITELLKRFVHHTLTLTWPTASAHYNWRADFNVVITFLFLNLQQLLNLHLNRPHTWHNWPPPYSWNHFFWFQDIIFPSCPVVVI